MELGLSAQWGSRGGHYNAISEQIHPDTADGEPRHVIGVERPLILLSPKVCVNYPLSSQAAPNDLIYRSATPKKTVASCFS